MTNDEEDRMSDTTDSTSAPQPDAGPESAFDCGSPQCWTLERFVRDSAQRGCRINHQGGGTCIDRQDSARAAAQHETQPEHGPRWGSDGDTGQHRDRVAAGDGLCVGCRAQRALAGEYFEPSPGKWYA